MGWTQNRTWITGGSWPPWIAHGVAKSWTRQSGVTGSLVLLDVTPQKPAQWVADIILTLELARGCQCQVKDHRQLESGYLSCSRHEALWTAPEWCDFFGALFSQGKWKCPSSRKIVFSFNRWTWRKYFLGFISTLKFSESIVGLLLKCYTDFFAVWQNSLFDTGIKEGLFS